MKQIKQLLIGLIAMAVASCNNATEKTTAVADAIYYDGDIITMESDSAAYVEAVAIKDGKIVFVGSKAEAEKLKGDSTAMNDLHGKTLVPGFVDGHAHFAGFGTQAVGANLLAPPDGNINTIDDLVKELKDWYAANGTDKTMGWIFGMGYDDAVLKEQRHPTKQELDKVSAEIPVVIVHILVLII